ncbi:MAG: DNA-binding protein [Rhodospirillales bacterium]|nr:DNA-binding protein [Rhodospirillales bacterium]
MADAPGALPLLSTKEAAKRLNLHPNTLVKWRSAGTGPEFIKIGRAVRYRGEAIESWLRRTTRQHTT